MPRTPISKPGKHGTLYRYRIAYNPEPGMCLDWHWLCWAYSAEHAAEKYDESNDDEGFTRTGEPERVYA